MRLSFRYFPAAIVVVAASLASAGGCGSGLSTGDSSGQGGSDSGTAVDGTVPPLAAAEAGTDSASTPDQGASERASLQDAGGTIDAGADVGPEAGDDGSTIPDAGRVMVPPGCTLPSTVSFTRDVQPFLASSCGNAGSNTGCHVLDATSTVAQGGYDHAYDWITGTAHSSSCPETPTPFRFQVVIAVIDESDPASCSECPEMPPTTGSDVRTPLTPCQAATLQSWLDEPLVTQMHRNDGISPTTPYPMPPFD